MHRTCWRPKVGLSRRFAPAGLTIVLSVAGCFQSGPPIAEVSGKVTFQGKPVTEGVVNFVSEAGFGVRATLEKDGSYRLRSHHGKGIPLDTYKVSISPPPFVGAARGQDPFFVFYAGCRPGSDSMLMLQNLMPCKFSSH